jgi:hypothetical protein
MNIRQIIFTGASFVILSAAILSFYFFYLALFPVKILEVKNSPVPATDRVVAGQTVTFEIDYCKHQKIRSHLEIVFEGSTIVPSVAAITSLPVGCNDNYKLPVSLPNSIPLGTRKALFVVRYEINSFHTERYEFESQPFEVVQSSE